MMTYLALTIGPIYGSIQNAKKVRELFGASYFFSWFMRQTLEALNRNSEIEIIVPYVDEGLLATSRTIGFFHDRFIARSDKMTIEEAKITLQKAIDATIDKAAETIGDPVKVKDLREYLTLHTLVLSEGDLKRVDENLIFAINKLLDAKEQHYPFGSQPPRTFRYEPTQDESEKWEGERFDELSPVNLFGYRLHRIKKGIGLPIESFKSTVELAGETKYYAVVTADGDKMGAKIKTLMEGNDDPQSLKSLSKGLHDFFLDASDIRKITNDQFGGELIFAGGDDVLALLPIFNNGKNLFEYLEELSKRFKEKVGDDVSLSFGVNIVYHKYPMQNAISEAFGLLHDAKAWGGAERNKVKVRLVKHSGQSYDTLHALGNVSFRSFKELLVGILTHKAHEKSEPCRADCLALPHAVHHTLDLYRYAIISARRDERSLEPFFDKIFDDVRSETEHKGLKKLREHIEALLPAGPLEEKESKERFNRLYGDLNIIKFLRGDRDDLSD